MDDGSSFEEEAMESELDTDDDDYSVDDVLGEWTASILGSNGDGTSVSREQAESESETVNEPPADAEPDEVDAASDSSANQSEQPQGTTAPAPAHAPEPATTAPATTGDAGDYIIGRSSDAAREFDATLRSHTVDEFKDEDEDFLRQLAQQRLATREKIRRREEERLAREQKAVPLEQSLGDDTVVDDAAVEDEMPVLQNTDASVDDAAVDDSQVLVPETNDELPSYEDYEPDDGDEYEPPESDDSSHEESSDESDAVNNESHADETIAAEELNEEPESSESTQDVGEHESAEESSDRPEEVVEQSGEVVTTAQSAPTIIAPVPSEPGDATHVIVSVADFEALSKRASINFGGLPPRISATTMDKKFGLAPDEKTQSVSIPSSLILFLSNLLQIGVLAFHGDSGLSDDEISILEKKYSKTAFARLSASRGDLFEAWVDYVVDRGTNPRLITAYTLATASNNIEGLTLDIAGIDDDTRRMITYFSAATKRDDQIEVMAAAMEDMRRSLTRIRSEQLELVRTATILERGQSYLIAESTGKATSHVGASPDGLSVLSSDAQKVYERVRSHVERDIQRKKDTDGRRVPADQRGAKKGVKIK